MTSTTFANNCRIGKVTFKSGSTLHVLPPAQDVAHTIEVEGGSVTFRMYGEQNMTAADVVYMCEQAKEEIMYHLEEEDHRA